MFFDGVYIVKGFDAKVMVTGNTGIHEMMFLKYDQHLAVTRGVAIVGARITLPGELEKQFMLGNIKKFGPDDVNL
ncbi:MAG: hypothetical protein ABW139_06610 [Candidatus Thiodiazotropha sp. DIVDIV]